MVADKDEEGAVTVQDPAGTTHLHDIKTYALKYTVKKKTSVSQAFIPLTYSHLDTILSVII